MKPSISGCNGSRAQLFSIWAAAGIVGAVHFSAWTGPGKWGWLIVVPLFLAVPAVCVGALRRRGQAARIDAAASREKRFSDTIINSLPGVFYLFDIDGKCLRWNSNVEKVTGYSHEEIAKRSPLDYFGEPDKPRAAASIQEAFQEGDSLLEAELVTKGGRRIPYLFSGHRLEWNGRPCVMGLGIDISKRRSAERALEDAQRRLQGYATELEQRVKDRTTRLQQSVESLEGLLYHVAHDVRAPLRTMGSFAEILSQDYADALGETGKDYTRRIANAAVQMEELLQDLLAYGRLTHITAPPEIVNLEAGVDRVLRAVAEQIQRTHAEVRVQRPLPVVKANAAVLDQVLAQLLTNALKFVPPQQPPSVSIRADAGPWVRLWIEDNGIGIDPAYHERIFGIFERLHPSEPYSGTGIGLAIVQKGVERLGGRVGLESELGRGSRFWIELPGAEGCGVPREDYVRGPFQNDDSGAHNHPACRG
jgi:PAS domain S-box-containing protein